MSVYGTGLYGTALYGDTAQFGARDLKVELFYSGRWVDWTSRVRTESGVRLGRGCSSEDIESSPSWCDLTFDNASGTFSPRNTSGLLYGLLKRNQPLRVGFGNMVKGAAGNGTGTTLTGPAFTTSYAAMATMWVGAVAPAANLTTPTGYGTATEDDALAFTVRRAFGTGSGSSGGANSTASGSPTGWAVAALAIPNGSYVSSQGNYANAGSTPAPFITAGATAGDVCVAVCSWSSDPYDRMGPPTFPLSATPVEVYLVADSGPSTGPRVMAWAWRHRTGSVHAYLIGAQDGATGAHISGAIFTGADRYAPRFTGEVADWPITWSKGAHNKTVSVRAGGVQRRIAQSQDVVSPLYSGMAKSSELAHYWPMEEESGATEFAPAVGTTQMVPVNGIAPSESDAIAGSKPLPTFTGMGARGLVSPPRSGPFGFGGVIAIPAAGLTAGTNLITAEVGNGGTVSTFGIEYTNSTTLTAKYSFTSGATASTSLGSLVSTFPNGLLGRQIFLFASLGQNGADVDYEVDLINITPGENLQLLQVLGTATVQTLGKLGAVTVGLEAGGSTTLGINGLSIGHVFATTGATFGSALYRGAAARGYVGSLITEAVYTTARDGGYQMQLTYPAGDTLKAGLVEADSVQAQVKDLAAAGQALMSDAAGFVGLEWRPLSAIVSQAPVFSFDYNAFCFADPFAPVDDDQTTLNDVTVETTQGARGRVQVTTGALGAQPGGVGRYSASYTLPAYDLSAALDLAGWMTGAGTLDAARWPEVTLEMSGAGNALLPMGALSIGDTIRLTNIPSFTGPATVDLVITGFNEAVDSALWQVTLVTRLAGVYRSLIWNDATFGVWADSAAPAVTDNRWSM